MRSLTMHLESARHQYGEEVLFFAEDIAAARKIHGPSSPYWVTSGLCVRQEDAETLFSEVDACLAKMKAAAPDTFQDAAVAAHTRLLTLLDHLAGEVMDTKPPASPAPAREATPVQHAPMDVDSEAPPIPSSAKGKGRAVEPIPLSGSSQPSAGPSTLPVEVPPIPDAAAAFLAAAMVTYSRHKSSEGA